jgi:hypothetical protein
MSGSHTSDRDFLAGLGPDCAALFKYDKLGQVASIDKLSAMPYWLSGRLKICQQLITANVAQAPAGFSQRVKRLL